MTTPTAGTVPTATPLVDATVVTAAYAMARWDLTCRAIESTLAQQPLPREILVAVDHNPELLARLRDRWEHPGDGGHPRIRIVPSRYDGHHGAALTTAAELAESTFLISLDDDAAADPGWLKRMLDGLREPNVLAVGGAPLPVYETRRPTWLPPEFNWVFGCAYVGLPTHRAPILHLIGTTMAVRRDDLLAIGGIHSDDFPDMEMSHRLRLLRPAGRLLYDPEATVRHFVPTVRTTWRYFRHRIFSVNRSKVWAVREMGEAGHLGAERGFVTRIAPAGILHGLRDALRGDLGGLARAGAILVGLALAAGGYIAGSTDLVLRDLTGRPGPKTGWHPAPRDRARRNVEDDTTV
ncbi:MAG: glycosyltransferase [Candidatus Limnocylindria bacterium]